MRCFATIAASVVLLLPSVSFAQHGSGMSAGFHGAPVMGRAVFSRPTPRATVGTRVRPGTRLAPSRTSPAGSHRVHRASNTSPRDSNAFDSGFNNGNNGPAQNAAFFQPFPPSEFSFNNVPGLGFDFPHMAAISGNQPQNNFGGFGGFGSPFGFGGVLLTSPVIIETGAAEQPATDEAAASNGADNQDNQDNQDTGQQNEGAQENESPSRYGSVGLTASNYPAPAPTASAQNDSRQYVFVRRDGSLVFAVAYSWEKDSLRYITPDGIRRSISGDTLDLEATRQFNEQRGLSFHLPA